MRRRSNIVVAAIAVVVSAAVGRAQRDAFTESVTEQGMRIWSFPDDGGERFTLAVLVGVGSRDESMGQYGIAHFLEHVVLARTARRPKAMGDPELEAIGAKVNGLTSHENTVYYLQCDAGDWRLAVDWLADHVLHPAFDPADVDAERRIVRAELGHKSTDTDEVTFEGLIYPRHALGRSVGGDPAGLGGIDAAALQRFYAEHYGATNMAVGFAGRVVHDECAAAIRTAFAGAPVGRLTPAGEPVRPRAGDLTPDNSSPAATASMIVGFHLPAATPRDLAMAQLIGAYWNGRFFTEVRERRQLAYAPDVDVTARRDTCRIDLRVDDVPDRRDLQKVLTIVDDLVAELRQVDLGRLQSARASLAGLFEASDYERLAAAMQQAWLLRRRGISPSELSLAAATISEREIAEFAKVQLTEKRRFVVADVPLARPFTPWAAVAVLAVLLLLLDSFQSFAKTRSMAQSVWRLFLRLRPRPRRRQAQRGAIVPFAPNPSPGEAPIVPVPGDEIEKSIQRYFEEEERGR